MTDSEIIKNAIAEVSVIAHKFPGILVLHDIREELRTLWMSQNGLDILGISLTEVQNMDSREYHSRYFNDEDAKDYVPKLHGLLERNDMNEFITFFQQVRHRQTNNWTWYVSSVGIYARGIQNDPLVAITTSSPIDAMQQLTAKAERLLRENNFLRKNFETFQKLSLREREILKLTALDKTATEIAATLFISPNTVETHKKNIRQKLKTNSNYELGEYARAFDLI